jgi:hypothetical protein
MEHIHPQNSSLKIETTEFCESKETLQTEIDE